jgi:hypothetical protein
VEESEEQVRKLRKAARELDHRAGDMEERTNELGADIDSVRQEFHRRRNDDRVPGLPPEPEAVEEQAGDSSKEISPAAEQPPGDGER